MPDSPALDASQRRVVELGDGEDAVVLGAPGSGKTLTAVELVADRVLERGWDPGEVLLLAASRHSAALLRDRLAARLRVPMPGSPARTVASLAHAVVSRVAVAAGEPPPRYLSGADHDRIIARLLEADASPDADSRAAQDADGWPVGPATRSLPAFRAELREVIARAAERGLDAEDLARLGGERGRPEWRAVAAFRRRLAVAIEAEFSGSTPLDATYVLRRATELVRDDDPAVPRPRLLVVDDAQELGRGGADLLAAFVARGSRLIALGDPDTATGGFRGARAGAFAQPEFWGERTPARLVLETVHRHGPELRAAVGAAVAAVGATAGAFEQRKAPAAGAPGTVEALVVPDAAGLSAVIARHLRELAVGGTAWSELAVVVRGGAAVPKLARELRLLDVPALGAGVTELRRDDWATTGLLDVARAALRGAHGELRLDPEEAEAILTGAVGRLDALSFRRLRAAMRRAAHEADPDDQRRAGELTAAALAVPGGFAWLERQEGRAAARVARVLHEAIEVVRAGASIEELLWTIWSGSGLDRIWGEQAQGTGLLADEANRRLDAVLALFAAAKRYVEHWPDGSPARFLEHWLGAEVAEDSLAGRADRGAVLVATPQALHGLEFEHVVIAELQDGVWPNARVRGSLLGAGDLADLVDGIEPATLDRRREVLHDEVRLLAAALGKARRGVLAVAIDGEETSPSPLLGLIGEARPSPAIAPLTLRGLVGRARNALNRAGDPTAAAVLARLAAAGVPGADPDSWQGLLPPSTDAPLAEADEEVDVHPSALGKWFECPLHWALARLGADPATTAASLGTIVHGVAHALAERQVDAHPDAILAAVLDRWGELEFEGAWLEERELRRARLVAERLAAYERDLRARGGTTIASETRLDLAIGRARLAGQIDRVERLVGEEGEIAVVVDFKTGRETRNSSPAQLADNPQLAAYQLGLLDGGIDGVDLGDAVPGDARLIVLGLGQDVEGYGTRPQPTLDAATAAAWRERIAAAADGMAEATFLAYVDRHCDSHSGGLCPIHVVGAVTG